MLQKHLNMMLVIRLATTVSHLLAAASSSVPSVQICKLKSCVSTHLQGGVVAQHCQRSARTRIGHLVGHHLVQGLAGAGPNKLI